MRYLVSIVVLALLLLSVPIMAQAEQVTHTVEPGDNLYRISLRYGVSMDEIARANNITNQGRILRGQVLVIPGLGTVDAGDTVENPLIAGTPITHTIQSGESLSIIAQQYNTTVDLILQSNDIANPNRIVRGQELTIWTTESVNDGAESAIAAEAADEAGFGVAPLSNILYEVQPGEHLSQIARRYGMAWTTLAQINGITDPNRVFAGQTLTIPALNADGTVANWGIIAPPQNALNAPTPTITQGRQIIVSLGNSMIYAFEDGRLVKSAVVSTGLPATPTVQGDFRIWHRTPSQTMSGPGYYLPNVQWVQYFYQGYGIHGTYWHNNFGQPMSHGCVNLTNEDAEWFYNFGEIGTAVRVQV